MLSTCRLLLRLLLLLLRCTPDEMMIFARPAHRRRPRRDSPFDAVFFSAECAKQVSIQFTWTYQHTAPEILLDERNKNDI